MNKTDWLIALPARLTLAQKLLLCVGFYVAATGLRSGILPADGSFVFGTYYPAAILVYFLCGRVLGTVFVLASMTTALLLFTPPDRQDATHWLAGYLLTLVAGVLIGEFLRILAVNATELRATRAQLQRFNVDLERRVAERTADLVRAHRELEAFSYSVSHDLRAPLRAVNGLAAITLEDHAATLPPGCTRLLERIREAGMRMGMLVDVLLSLSRLELGQVPDRPVDPAGLVHEAYAELQALYPVSLPRLSVHELPPCRAQPELLRQVWKNLLSNAIRHSYQRADAQIDVGCEQSGPVAAYYVRDNGEGFDMRYADKVFKPFERLHEGNQFGGVGIGLAIVRRIVERHGGRAWVQSQAGVGATFYFTLIPEPHHA